MTTPLRGIGLPPGYFDVIGTPIVKGRGISEQDTAASRHVAVINEAFARKFFRNEDPIGKHFGRKPAASREFEVVGVAKDARYLTYNLDQPIGPFFFLPEAQADYTQANLGSLFLRDIVILTRPGANLSVAAVRQAMASVDPGMPVISIRTLTRAGGQSVHPAAAHRTPHFVLRGSFACPGFDRAVWSYCLQCRTPRQRDRRAYGVGRRIAATLSGWCCEAHSG